MNAHMCVCVCPEGKQMDGHHMVAVVSLEKHLPHPQGEEPQQIRSNTCVEEMELYLNKEEQNENINIKTDIKLKLNKVFRIMIG